MPTSPRENWPITEGVVRPGCFDGVVPANGRLYWMPLACDCWQVHGTFCMAPRPLPLKPRAAAGRPAWAAPFQRAGGARRLADVPGQLRPGRPRFPPPFRKR